MSVADRFWHFVEHNRACVVIGCTLMVLWGIWLLVRFTLDSARDWVKFKLKMLRVKKPGRPYL